MEPFGGLLGQERGIRDLPEWHREAEGAYQSWQRVGGLGPQ